MSPGVISRPRIAVILTAYPMAEGDLLKSWFSEQQSFSYPSFHAIPVVCVQAAQQKGDVWRFTHDCAVPAENWPLWFHVFATSETANKLRRKKISRVVPVLQGQLWPHHSSLQSAFPSGLSKARLDGLGAPWAMSLCPWQGVALDGLQGPFNHKLFWIPWPCCPLHCASYSWRISVGTFVWTFGKEAKWKINVSFLKHR